MGEQANPQLTKLRIALEKARIKRQLAEEAAQVPAEHLLNLVIEHLPAAAGLVTKVLEGFRDICTTQKELTALNRKVSELDPDHY